MIAKSLASPDALSGGWAELGTGADAALVGVRASREQLW
jgi:hypothetical protein